jgi:predicted amino acid racemase
MATTKIDDGSGSTTEIDTLKFTDLNQGDVTKGRVGDTLMIGITPTGATIKVDYQFYSQTANWGIEKIEFADGTSWNLATIDANAWYNGTGGK